MIQCYSHTKDKDESVMEELYMKLQSTICNQRIDSIKIFMVEWMLR